MSCHFFTVQANRFLSSGPFVLITRGHSSEFPCDARSLVSSVVYLSFAACGSWCEPFQLRSLGFDRHLGMTAEKGKS